MTLKDRKKLTIFIHEREKLAKELKALYDDENFHGSTQKLEIRLDNITFAIKDLILPAIHGKYYDYDNA